MTESMSEWSVAWECVCMQLQGQWNGYDCVAQVPCNMGWKMELFSGDQNMYSTTVRVCVCEREREREREDTRVRKLKCGDLNKQLYAPPT